MTATVEAEVLETCAGCGRPLTTPPPRNRPRCCSDSCQRAAQMTWRHHRRQLAWLEERRQWTEAQGGDVEELQAEMETIAAKMLKIT